MSRRNGWYWVQYVGPPVNYIGPAIQVGLVDFDCGVVWLTRVSDPEPIEEFVVGDEPLSKPDSL